MEIEESQPNLAPIAEPEMPLQQEEEESMANEHKIQKNVASSSATDDTGRNFAESVIGPNDNGNGGGIQPKVGMVRMRRKRRRLDPFGNLILSTKKMKLNDSGIPGASAGEGQQQAKGSVECGEDDELVFYYGGEDDSADGYDDDEDSNAEKYYKNDYPDEGGNEFENESTSEDDYFDHYGDEQVKYRNYCHDKESSDRDEDDFD